MNIIQGIEKGDKAVIIFSTSVLAGFFFGIWRKQGFIMNCVYGAAFGTGALIINKTFNIK